MPKPTFPLTIRSRQDIVFQADVNAVSSLNQKGPFDVLPHHAFFITIVERYIVVHQTNGENLQFKIDSGVLHVDDAQVHIYVESLTVGRGELHAH
jgi:F0F1-type ATP synthase epsilon subunit